MTRGEAVNWIINISADIGKVEHRELWHYEQALLEIREMLESEPERKTGKWKPDRDNERDWYCSECDYLGNRWFKYCPNCGADMRGGNER